jgi:hypothetical protein
MDKRRRTTRRSRVALTVVIAGLVMTLSPIASAKKSGSTVPNPTVTGPITGGIHGHPFTQHPYELGPHGYMEEEYFLAGIAYSDGIPGPNEYSNGTRAGYADYVTRILVIRPIDKKKFNGTAVVEWFNTSAGMDGAVEWSWAHPMLMREGFAYVGVSAQSDFRVSATAGPVTVTRDGLGPFALKNWDPVRYAPLSHPGDEFARDIFSQALQAIRSPVNIAPLGNLRAKRVLAVGQSQSADRLGTYVERDQATAKLVDGFLIDDDQRGNPSYGDFPLPNPGATKIMNFRSEAFLSGSSPTSARNYRRWEVGGTSHIDYWTIRWSTHGSNIALDTPKGSAEDEALAEDEAGNYGERVDPTAVGCLNQGPRRYANQAAIAALNTWVRTGKPAPSAPPIETVDGPTGQTEWARDDDGNVFGGYRLPPLDVPVATYVGNRCQVLGTTVPFDPARVKQLYASHEDYVLKMQQATNAAVARGWLLPADAQDLMRRASESSIGAPPGDG